MNKRFFKWLVVNSVIMAALVAWLFFGVEGAANLVKFTIGAMLTLSTVCCMVIRDEKMAETWPTVSVSSVPKSFDITYDLIFIGLLVWFGHPVWASLYAVFSLIMQPYVQNAAKECLEVSKSKQAS